LTKRAGAIETRAHLVHNAFIVANGLGLIGGPTIALRAYHLRAGLAASALVIALMAGCPGPLKRSPVTIKLSFESTRAGIRWTSVPGVAVSKPMAVGRLMIVMFGTLVSPVAASDPENCLWCHGLPGADCPRWNRPE